MRKHHYLRASISAPVNLMDHVIPPEAVHAAEGIVKNNHLIGEENTTIAGWDIERAVQARYRADIDTLQRFFSNDEGER